jgi:predicted nucleic acid-binding protein
MLIYADGSALSRFLASEPESADWLPWAEDHADQIVTSPLGLTELRRAAHQLDSEARQAAHALAGTITVVRIFDQSLKPASLATSVLSPFAALHLGIAVAHPGVHTVATYDISLAQVAVLHRLEVVSPGRPDGWWTG